MNEQNKSSEKSSQSEKFEPNQNSNNNKWALIILPALVAAFLVGGAVFAWQKTIINNIKAEYQEKIQNLEQEIDTLQNKLEGLQGDAQNEDISFSERKIEYEQISQLTSVDGKLAYVARQGDKNFVVHDGEEGKKYPLGNFQGEPRLSIQTLSEVNGKVAYEIAPEQVIEFFVYGEKEVKADGVMTTSPVGVNGKLAYVRGSNIVFDGEELGLGFYPAEVNGKLAYGDKGTITYNGKKYGSEYGYVGPPKEVNGKLTYKAEEAGKQFIVYGGEEMKKYASIPSRDFRIFSPVGIAGNLAFKLSYGDQSCIVMGGKERKKYDRVSSPVEVDGKLTYVAEEDGEYFVVHGEREHERYHRVWHLREIGGNPTYVVPDKNLKGDFIVWGDKKVGEDYDLVIAPTEVDGKFVFAGRRGSSWYIVEEN